MGQIEVAICATVAVWEVRDAIAEDDTTRAWATSTATTARRRILCAARQWHARTAVAAGLMAAGVAAAAPRGSERQAMPRALILILLYIGCVERNPGPSTAEAEGRRTLRVATMNAPGQHVVRRTRTGMRVEEGWGDGWELQTNPGETLRATVEKLKNEVQCAVAAIPETRTRREEMAAVAGHWAKAKWGHIGAPAVEYTIGKGRGAKRTKWGVSIVWQGGA